DRLADAAGAYPERPDAVDEGPRLRFRLRLRPRRRRRLLRPELLSRRHGAAALLQPGRARLRTRGAQAPGVFRAAARQAPRRGIGRGMTAPGFDVFLGIDWSGAKGRRLNGLRVARCTPGRAAPALLDGPQP